MPESAYTGYMETLPINIVLGGIVATLFALYRINTRAQRSAALVQRVLWYQN